MDEMRTVFNNAIALVKDPVGYMTQHKGQDVPVNSLMINYVAVLALVPLVGRIIGDLAFYGGAGLGYSIFVIGMVIWKLAPSFNTTTDQAKSTVLAAYVYTPVFLIGILNIIPFLGYLAFLGLLYGLYILYRGLPILLNTPADKTVIYVVAVLVVSIIILFIISVIIGGLDAAALR
jgi:hypothetical protein